MPFNISARKARVSRQPRDKDGHFIPVKATINGSGKVLSDLIKTEKDDDAFNIFTLRMGKPWEKLIQVLEDIKKKQATKVNLSFTIPLVVLPVVLLGAFTLGRWYSGCGGYFSSQVGTLQNITVTRKFAPDNFVLNLLTYVPYLGEYLYQTKTLTQPVIIKNDAQAVIIENEANLNLNHFDQAKVIVFGNYNSCSQTLTLDSDKNISNY